MIDEKSWSWSELFALIKFDLKKIVIGIAIIAVIVAVLNGFVVYSGIQDVYQCLVYDRCGEYVGWVVYDLLSRRYVTLADLIIAWDEITVFLIYFVGILAMFCLVFFFWKVESVKQWLDIHNKSTKDILFFKLGIYFIAIAIYVALIVLSQYVYFLIMKNTIPAVLISSSGSFSLRLFLNISQTNLLLWFLAFIYGIITVIITLK